MKVLSVANKARQLKNDPIGFILDSLIAIIVNLFIPIPLAGTLVSEFISQFKAPLLGLLASLVLLAIFMITVVGTIVTLPIIASTGFFSQIFSPNLPGDNPLHIPPDTSFVATNVPKQNPFGGSGMSYTTTTAYFMDPDYYLKFGKNHMGIDFIPSDEYFKSSQTYKNTQKVVIFATMNGRVRHYVDQYGGETVEITNTDNSVKVLYVHFSIVLVESGSVVPGTPIGIMGETGFATGEHLHYEIQTKDGNNWIATNPLNYIQ
ncbi:MAG: M23 family metallopeptidase [Candidatus Levyibacteriota bacterium]|nr:MAG: M23 family metallopeptidase [Candidatus Levybacteria bacterium]